MRAMSTLLPAVTGVAAVAVNCCCGGYMRSPASSCGVSCRPGGSKPVMVGSGESLRLAVASACRRDRARSSRLRSTACV